MIDLIKKVCGKAKKDPKRIVFPESQDERVIRAIETIVEEGYAKPILLGNKETIAKFAENLGVKLDLDRIQIVDPEAEKERKDNYTRKFYELRKEKGITLDQARKILENRDYFGTMMVYLGDADGMVSGATSPTADTLRPALQIIKTKEKFHKVSGVFFMVLENRLLLFADAAVNIDPNSYDLAEIAADSAQTAKHFGIEPRVALLSFSTHSSAKHPNVDKVREATAVLKERHPEILCDGELQVDAAIVPEVAKRKCPNSPLQGTANVLIFPCLDAANISYKLVERLAKAQAIGPILQGLKKPVNDLSRGCSAEDIVNVAAFTVAEAQKFTSL